MTTQEHIKALLEESGIAYKEIKVYGHQIVITAWSRDAAEKWASLLAKFCTVRAVLETLDEAKKQTKTCLNTDYVKVFRVFGRI